MRKSDCTLKGKQGGFTLLEVMLVFLLMAMVSVGVIITLPSSSSPQEGSQWQAQRFMTLVRLAEDEALATGVELGLVFEENSYQFAFYDYQTRKWLPIINKQFQDRIELPEMMTINYTMSGITWDELDIDEQDEFIDDDDLVSIEGQEKIESLYPQVYLMSSGEVTPFTVDFSVIDNGSNTEKVTVSVSMTGTVTLSEM